MDKKEFDERVLRLQDIAGVIDQLPAEIRSDAFALLKGYVSEADTSDSSIARNGDKHSSDLGDDDNLLGRFDHAKPSDNVRLIAAYLFEQYGAEPFTVDEMKVIAAEAGITVPARIDMTLHNAKENGKNLFVNLGNGKFKPTVHGESNLKDTYGVKKGTKKREEVAK